MSDVYTLRIVGTPGFDEQNAEELFALRLDGAGSGEIETAYRNAAIRFLADHEIYAWRVRDERVLTSTGASAEFHDVVVFLAGAGAAAFTAEFGKRLANLLQDLLAHAHSLDCGRHEDLTLLAGKRRMAGFADVSGDELRLSHVGRAIPASGHGRVRAFHLRGRLLSGCRLIALPAEQPVQKSHHSPRCPRLFERALS